MIDVHCHLEQPDYDNDREDVIKRCRENLKAVITCCVHPKNLDLTMKMMDNHENFIFAAYGIHPEYIKDLNHKEIDNFIERIKESKERIVAVGETGLDFFWIKEREWQKKQEELFIQLIDLSKQIKKPLLIHSRDAYEDILKILEQEDARKVLLHLWGGYNLIGRVEENNWNVSVGPILLRSKKYKKMVRDISVERIMTETDSPWFGIGEKRGYPTNVKFVIEKIAEIKKMGFNEVDKITTENAIKFFELKI